VPGVAVKTESTVKLPDTDNPLSGYKVEKEPPPPDPPPEPPPPPDIVTGTGVETAVLAKPLHVPALPGCPPSRVQRSIVSVPVDGVNSVELRDPLWKRVPGILPDPEPKL
jgi:hypothetical protein